MRNVHAWKNTFVYIFKAQFLNMDWCKSFEQDERDRVRANANALSFGKPSAFLASYSRVVDEAKKDW